MSEKDDFASVLIRQHCSSLESEDRKKRKQALERLYQDILNKDDLDIKKTVETFDLVHKQVWKCFYDKAEAVRDAALTFMEKGLELVPPEEKYLGQFIPIIAFRLGEQELNEPSEEIRLRLVVILTSIIVKYQVLCGPYVEEIVQVLVKTLVDSHPKVRSESSTCVCKLAETIPRYFFNQSCKLIKPILASFNHQHFRLRIAAIQALGSTIRYGNNKNLNAQEVFPCVAQRLFDSTPAVRSATTKVVGNWLLNLPDRYSYFTKLVPLILTSLCDELPELREEAWDIWCKAGQQYVEENDDELKDKTQFLYEKPTHYPKNVERPNLGCRTLVQRNTCQVTPAIKKELEDWKNDIRIKTAQLLCWLVLHNETHITQHSEGLLLTMYKVCNQEDMRIVENIEKAAEYLAYFVPPDVHLKLVLPVLEDTLTVGHLTVFSALLRGSEKTLLLPHLHEITEFLCKDSTCRSRVSRYHIQLLRCCEALLDVCGDECSPYARAYFIVIITVLATANHEEVVNTCNELLEKLRVVVNSSELEELYAEHIKTMLDKVEETVSTWTSVSYDYLIFHLLLQEASPVIGRYLGRVSKILAAAMNPEGDAFIRLKLFTLLSMLLTDKEVSMKYADVEDFNSFLLSLVQDVITPNLIWHAGRTAEALRTAAIACLCTTILPQQEGAGEDVKCNLYFTTTEVLEDIFKTLLPILLTSSEDSIETTRLYTLKSMKGLIGLTREREKLTPDHVNQIYPVLTKRLDDVSDEVRLLALECLKCTFRNLPADYDPVGFRPHLQVLYSTMLIHLDDPNEEFQNIMLETLKEVGKVSPQILWEKINSTKDHFRNKVVCDEVMTYLKTCPHSSG